MLLDNLRNSGVIIEVQLKKKEGLIMDLVGHILSKSLSVVGILCFAAVCVLLIFLYVLLDTLRRRRKTRRFLKRHQDAAVLIVYARDPARNYAEIECEEGEASPVFYINVPFGPEIRKGKGCYVAPGLAKITIILHCPGSRPEGRTKRNVSGQFVFTAEPEVIYDAVFDTASGRSVLIQRNGQAPGSVLQQNEGQGNERQGAAGRKSKRKNIWDNPGKTSITAEFYRREVKRVTFLSIMIFLPMIYLVLWARLPYYFLLLPAVVLLFALIKMLAVGTKKFQHVFDVLSPHLQERIQRDFQNPHPVYKLFGGEVHLLPDGLIFRSGGLLSMVLLEQIERIQSVRYSGSRGLAKSLVVRTNTGKKYQLEFAGTHMKELAEVASWIKAQNPRIFEG